LQKIKKYLAMSYFPGQSPTKYHQR